MRCSSTQTVLFNRAAARLQLCLDHVERRRQGTRRQPGEAATTRLHCCNRGGVALRHVGAIPPQEVPVEVLQMPHQNSRVCIPACAMHNTHVSHICSSAAQTRCATQIIFLLISQHSLQARTESCNMASAPGKARRTPTMPLMMACTSATTC